MEVIFVRHGPAEESEWMTAHRAGDFDRPLTEAGAAAVERTARALRTLVSSVSLIVSSPLVRSQQTAEILAKRLNVTEIHSDPALRSEAAPSDTVAALGRYDGSTIICVGHQPNISASISLALAGSVKSIIQVGRGAACGVRFAGSCRPGAGELLFLLPRQLFQPE